MWGGGAERTFSQVPILRKPHLDMPLVNIFKTLDSSRTIVGFSGSLRRGKLPTVRQPLPFVFDIVYNSFVDGRKRNLLKENLRNVE
jgi:hypothetical protein